MTKRVRFFAISAALMLSAAACGPRFQSPQAQPDTFETVSVLGGTPSTVPSASTTSTTKTQLVRRLIGSRSDRGFKVTGGTITIGGLFPLSGGLSSIGTPAAQGAQAWFRYVNDHGGIEGKKIKFIPCDDRADDTQSTVCAKRLVEEEGIFAMGPSFTPFSETVVSQLDSEGVPWIGWDGINKPGFSKSTVVTVGAAIEPMAHALVPYWYRQIEKETGIAPKKIGAVTLDVGPAGTYITVAKKYLCPKLGCTIVKDQRVNYQTTEYGTICRSMQNEKVDTVWIVTDPASAIKLFTFCREIGYKPRVGFLGQHGIVLDLTLKQSGPFANGTMANSAVVPDTEKIPPVNEMKSIMRTYYPDVSFGYWNTLAFASARMFTDLVGDVLRSGKELNRQTLLEAAAGHVSYDCHGLCKDVNLTPPMSQSGGNHWVWIVKAQNGHWVKVAGPLDAYQSETWPCPGRPCA
ncbi:MAG: ABC transporter substrate-binding protein [Actinobacteria bacterium]|nr:ABC transporter substrate-binding protein [Actinomycetota bacterium]